SDELSVAEDRAPLLRALRFTLFDSLLFALLELICLALGLAAGARLCLTGSVTTGFALLAALDLFVLVFIDAAAASVTLLGPLVVASGAAARSIVTILATLITVTSAVPVT